MKIIGVTGGVGCGKSEVLNALQEEFGAVCVRADEVSKSLMQKGGICYEPVRALFGNEVVGPDGEFDRGKIASKIFGHEALRLAMNRIMHPAVKKAILEDIEAKRQEEAAGHRECPGQAGPAGKETLYVIEAALLLEENYDEICNEVWYVYADEKVRRKRLAETRGYSDEKITSIMRSQKPEEYFREHTDLTLDNSGDFADTREQIRDAVRRITGMSFPGI